MENNSNREFNCKNEELPVVCRFVGLSLERDMTTFTTYSPIFDAAYLEGYRAKILAAEELIAPKSETVELKLITEHSYATLDGLIGPINYLEGYISLAGKKVPITAADFGLAQLRKSCRSRDVEHVLASLRTVNGNIKKYKTELTAKGLTDELAAKFSDALLVLADDSDKRYKLVSNRAALVQSNMEQLNELNAQLVEICDIGKILFKQTDKAKLKDYTFTQLMKKVRRTEKPEENKPQESNGDTDNPEPTEDK